MVDKHQKFRDLAVRLVGKDGQPLTLIKGGDESGYDRDGNAAIPTPEQKIKGLGVKLNYTTQELQNENIRSSDAKLLFVCDDVNDRPQTGMRVFINSLLWVVQPVMALEIATLPIMYTLQIRRG